MTDDDAASAAAHAGTQVGAAVAAALAARELTEARVREIVREELAAHAAKLGHDGVEALVGDARPALDPLDPVLQVNRADGKQGHPLGDDAVELIKAMLDIVLTDGAKGQEAFKDCLARRHGVGNLIEHGAEHRADFLGVGHETSPSLDGLDSLSVGESPRPDAQPASGAGHQGGGGAR